MSSSSERARTQATVRSALWAAYGDALGFMSELVARPAMLAQRLGVDHVQELQPWKRRVGGRFGVELTLPAGTYSDDTQLRLATSRAIRSSGRFDIEAFSKVELPIFLAYELGCGRSTRTAASELGKRSTRWANNFFERDGTSYVGGGGNGAAMRIQPHVWASRSFSPDEFLGDVFANAICTHGHARGFVGAAWHAISLAAAMRERAVPDLDAAADHLRATGQLPELVRDLPLIGELWVPVWERQANQQLEEAVGKTIEEGLDDLERARQVLATNGAYADLVGALGATDPATRGSGIKSAVLASTLALLHQDNARSGLREAANALGSDTDTVATMAGALLGAAANDEPPAGIQDQAYIVTEAERLARLGLGVAEPDFPYPDPLKWTPPKTQIDAVGETDGVLAIAGLGPATAQGEPTRPSGREHAVWQWLALAYGQSILVRRREKLRPLAKELLPGSAANGQHGQGSPTLFDQQEAALTSTRERPPRINLDSASKRAISSDFDPALIGQHLLAFADGEQGIEFAVAYAAIIAKARVARRTRSTNPGKGEQTRGSRR